MENNVPAATPNMELVDLVFKAIREDLAHWSQLGWATNYDIDGDGLTCNTYYCFGGWALSLSNRLRKPIDGGPTLWNAVDKDGNWMLFQDAANEVLGFNDLLGDKVYHNFTSNIDEFEKAVRQDIVEYGHLTAEQVAEIEI